MIKSLALALATLSATGAAQALEDEFNMALLSCNQFMNSDWDMHFDIAMWIDGYLSNKVDNLVVKWDSIEVMDEYLHEHCEENPRDYVLQTILNAVS